MTWAYDLTQLVKNDNSENLLLFVGEIVAENPLKISMAGGELLAGGENLLVTRVLLAELDKNRQEGIENVGQQVAVLGRQKFLAIGLVTQGV